MAFKLHTNGVITGSLNSFCLACQSFLKSEQEANDHIGTASHKTNLSGVQYSDKFKDEHIRKFKGGYYCEFCNVLLPIAAKINLHLTEDEHKHNKGILLLKPMGDDVVALNNIHIEGKAWHGLIEGICSVCNVEFDDEKEHRSDPSHSLNLVLKPVRFGTGNAIYRHLDDSAVLCLTCNKLLAPSNMTQHFNDTEHLELYSKCRIETNGVSKEIESNGTAFVESKLVEEDKKDIKSKTDINCNKITKPSGYEKSKIIESIAEYQRKGININLETDTAFCKKCSKVIIFECKEIENHVENHSPAEVDSELQYPSNLDQNLNRLNINDKSTKKSEKLNGTDTMSNSDSENNVSLGSKYGADTKKSDSTPEFAEKMTDKGGKKDPKAFAKENQITYNEDYNRAYCRICEVKLPSSLNSMKEHVAGAVHTKMAANKTHEKPNDPKPLLVKQETKFYLDSSYEISGLFVNEKVINEEFCIPKASFWLISANGSRLRCILCEVTLPPFTHMDSHIETEEHASKIALTPVIISEKSEFIREIRPELFHCGYCHLVVSGWTEMKQHLKCSEHKEKRSHGERRLQLHLPKIQMHKQREHMELMRMMWAFNQLG